MDLIAAVAAADNFPVPDQVAPFPDSGDLLYAAIPHSLGHNPQKLRPIRSAANGGGRSSSPPPLHDAHFCLLNDQLLEPPDPPPHDSLLTPTEYPLGSGSGQVDGRPFQPGQESGSSLDDVGNGGGNSAKEPGSKTKRRGWRRKMEKKLEHFVENMVVKVLEKQEQMHNQLVDLIETKERERIMREEAWREQEMERIKKDEEARAQDRTRNLALISFIHNVLGHEIPIPQPTEVGIGRGEGEHEGEASIQKNFNGDASNHRWPDVEVQALITVRTSVEHKFCLLGSSKVSIWEEISEAMRNLGYNRSAKKCKEKWENINKYYKKTMESGKRLRLNSKSRPYFNELDTLHRNTLLNHGNALSNTNDAANTEKE